MISLGNEIQLGSMVQNRFGDKFLYSVNRTSFELLDYQSQFQKEFEDEFEQEDTLYIIAGTDSGLMVKQLLKKPPKKGSTYLFIEFPEIISLVQDQYDISEQPKIIVTTLDNWQKEAQKILDELLERSGKGYFSAFFISYIYAGLGKNDNALEWLEKSIEDHDVGVTVIKTAPHLEHLHLDPRWSKLVHKMGLAD